MDIFFWGMLLLLGAIFGLAIFYGLQRTNDRIDAAQRFATSQTDTAINRGIDPTQAYLNVLQGGKPEDLVNAPLPSFFSEDILLQALLRIQNQPTLYDRFIERLSQCFTLGQYERLVSAWTRYCNSLGEGMAAQNVFMGELSKRLTAHLNVKQQEDEAEPEQPDDMAPESELAHHPLAAGESISIGSPLETTPPLYHLYPYNDVRASDRGRFEHVYMIGKTGAGKSNTLKHLIAQDLQNAQKGVIVISPEPELLEDLLPYIPEDRHDDLVYFDPSVQNGHVVGWNPFDFSDADGLPKAKRDHLLNQRRQNIAVVLERAMGEFGVSMRTVLKQAVSALLQMPNTSFRDFARLIDPHDATLRDIVEAARSIEPETREFWTKYQQSSYFKTAHGAVLNRLGDFLTPPLSVVFSTHTLSWQKILSKPSIVFLDLSRIGGDPLATAGQLLIAAIQTTLYERIQLPEEQRLPYYYMYIDEFAKFVGAEASFRELFGRIRKCNVGLTVAHQTRADLTGNLEGAIVGNVKTMTIMQVSAQDAPFFARELQLFDLDTTKYDKHYADFVVEAQRNLYEEHLQDYLESVNDDRYPNYWAMSDYKACYEWVEARHWTKKIEAEVRQKAREASRGSINPLIIQNLKSGQAIVRLEADGFPQGVAVSIPHFVQKPRHDMFRLIDASRKRYGKRLGDERDERVDDERPADHSAPDDLDDFLQ